MDDVLFSSSSDEWGTPAALFEQINETFGPFDLDPCATPDNAKTASFYTAADNGLRLPWTTCETGSNVFVNPPFCRKKRLFVDPWIRKAWEEVQCKHATQVVMLIPARTETLVWHDIIWQEAALIAFVKGRINFVRPDGSTGPAPFPSAIVVFRDLPDWAGKPRIMAWEQRRAATQGV